MNSQLDGVSIISKTNEGSFWINVRGVVMERILSESEQKELGWLN